MSFSMLYLHQRNEFVQHVKEGKKTSENDKT